MQHKQQKIKVSVHTQEFDSGAPQTERSLLFFSETSPNTAEAVLAEVKKKNGLDAKGRAPVVSEVITCDGKALSPTDSLPPTGTLECVIHLAEPEPKSLADKKAAFAAKAAGAPPKFPKAAAPVKAGAPVKAKPERVPVTPAQHKAGVRKPSVFDLIKEK